MQRAVFCEVEASCHTAWETGGTTTPPSINPRTPSVSEAANGIRARAILNGCDDAKCEDRPKLWETTPGFWTAPHKAVSQPSGYDSLRKRYIQAQVPCAVVASCRTLTAG